MAAATELGIAFSQTAKGWRIYVTKNGIEFKSSTTYPTKVAAGAALVEAFPDVSSKMLADILTIAEKADKLVNGT